MLMSADDIRSKAFEWACDYKPFDTDLEYSKYAEEGYVQGYIQAKTDLERQLEEEKELNQTLVDANEQYIAEREAEQEAHKDTKAQYGALQISYDEAVAKVEEARELVDCYRDLWKESTIELNKLKEKGE